MPNFPRQGVLPVAPPALPAAYATWKADNEDSSWETVVCLGIAINEAVRGREWQIFLPVRRTLSYSEDDEETQLSQHAMTLAFHVTPHEILGPTPVGKTVKEWRSDHLRGLLQLAINGAMLITARGVPKREMQLPRHQRKRIARQRWAPRMPKLYYVDLAEAGEEMETAPKSRTYHVRWLVSGHWRHLDNGESLCTCPKHRHSPRPATYIDPYVKGPPGAPWIGRPVHRAV